MAGRMDKIRSLSYPEIKGLTVEAILHVLSDPVRVDLRGYCRPGLFAELCCFSGGNAHRTIPKSTLSQPFRILREAGLIYSERKGVEMLTLRAVLMWKSAFRGCSPRCRGACHPAGGPGEDKAKNGLIGPLLCSPFALGQGLLHNRRSRSADLTAAASQHNSGSR